MVKPRRMKKRNREGGRGGGRAAQRGQAPPPVSTGSRKKARKGKPVDALPPPEPEAVLPPTVPPQNPKRHKAPAKPAPPRATASVDPEDAEIARLEALLSGRRKKGPKVPPSRVEEAAKLNKAYASVGLGDDIGDFMLDLDDLTARVGGDDSDTDSEDGFPPLPSEGSGEEADSDEEVEEAPTARVEDREERAKRQAAALYGQGESATPWVPSRVRAAREAAANGADDDAKVAKLRRLLQGVVNRLSESNLEPLTTEIVALYDAHSTALLNQALTAIIMASASNDSQVLRTLIMCMAGCVAALHYRVDRAVSAHVLEAVTHRYLALAGQESKQRNNLLLFLCYLYVFGIVNEGLVFDVLDALVADFDEVTVELLLLALQHCGFQLRRDAADRLRKFLGVIESHAKSAPGVMSTRAVVMLDMIADLKKNRLRQAQQHVMDRAIAIRKWLNRVASKHPHAPPLLVSLDDLASSKVKGRWWVVGGAWAGNQILDGASGPKAAAGAGAAAAAQKSAEERRLLRLARKMRMNTDIRRSVFVALVGAEDPDDAVYRAMKLGLKGTNEREIVRVLVDCGGQEREYNPYYADVALRLCSFHNRFKFTFQLTLWDVLKTIEEDPTHRVQNLANMYAALFGKFSLSLAVLKVVDFTTLSSRTALFLVTCFLALLRDQADETIVSVFSRVGAGVDRGLVKGGLMVFLRDTLKPAVHVMPEDCRADVRKRVRIATRALEAIDVDEEDLGLM